MDILHSGHEFLQVFAGGLFLQLLVLDDEVEKFTAARVLHHEVQVFVGLDDFVQMDHVGVPHLLQNLDLSADALDVLRVLDPRLLEHLDGHLRNERRNVKTRNSKKEPKQTDAYLFAREHMRPQLHLAEGTLTESFAEDVVSDGVAPGSGTSRSCLAAPYLGELGSGLVSRTTTRSLAFRRLRVGARLLTCTVSTGRGDVLRLAARLRLVMLL